MKWTRILAAWVVAWLAGAVVADAQEIPPPRVYVPSPPAPNPAPSSGAATQPTEVVADPNEPPPLGPAPAAEEPQVPPAAAPAVVGSPPGGRGVGTGPPDAQFAAEAVGAPSFTSIVEGIEAELGPGEALGVTGPRPPMPGYGLEAESQQAQIAEDVYQGFPVPRWGPTPVANVRILMNLFGLDALEEWSNIRTFGWVEGGYTGASVGPGILSVQTRQNRFGDEFLLNQIGWVIQKPLRSDEFDIGFNMRYFAGADAALGAPKGGIDSSPNPHFGQDFRDLYLSAHLPVLTENGVDFKIGRMNTIIGYNGFLAPYRPFYSSDYQFFYLQDGAFTGFLLDFHITPRLDIWSGMTLGANTFFVTRSAHSYCYIGQINYWLTDEQRTRLTASVYTGPNALFSAPGLAGNFDSMVELRIVHDWSPRFTQVVQSNMGWDANTPVGTSGAYGVYTIGLFHLTNTLDINGRAEWFDDAKGTRTGIKTNYSEVTGGLNFHPVRWLEFRPEIRGDFAGAPAFGRNGAHNYRDQLTGGISFLVKF
jgi:Putative beta-barrel porin-2, OmpL-like. bbp2